MDNLWNAAALTLTIQGIAGPSDPARRSLRQPPEQYFTSSQFLAHLFRHVIGRPQATQGFEGSERLLPLNESMPRVMAKKFAASPSTDPNGE